MGSLGVFNPSFLGRAPQLPAAPDPLETYGRALSLQAMMAQRELRAQQLKQEQYQLQRLQDQAEQRRNLSSLIARTQNLNDPEFQRQAYLTAPDVAPPILQNIYAGQKEQEQTKQASAATRLSEAETDLKRLDQRSKYQKQWGENLLALSKIAAADQRRNAFLSYLPHAVKNNLITQQQSDEWSNLPGLPTPDVLTSEIQRNIGGAGMDEWRIKELQVAQEQAKQEQSLITSAARDAQSLGDQPTQDEWNIFVAKHPEVASKLPPFGVGAMSPTKTLQRMAMTAAELTTAQGQAEERATKQQELELKRQELAAKEDPLGLFRTAPGAPAAAPGAAPTASGAPVQLSPMAGQIANFEGYNKPGSVAQRNNNPGNLRDAPTAIGHDKDGYAIFRTPQDGAAALEAQIRRNADKGLTFNEFFAGKPGVYPGYAPASDRNDPAAYAKTVATNLGVDPTAKVSDVVGGAPTVAPQQGAGVPYFGNLHGDTFLQALPGGINGPLAARVKDTYAGNLELKDDTAGRQMYALVKQYNPDFNPGQKPLGEDAIKRISDDETGIQALQKLRATLDKNKEFLGPIAGLHALIPGSKAQTVRAEVNQVKQLVGKALEGGVLRKEDEEKYKEILPIMFDKPQIALDKADMLIASLQQRLNIYKQEQRKAGRRVDMTPQSPTPAATPGVEIWGRDKNGKLARMSP